MWCIFKSCKVFNFPCSVRFTVFHINPRGMCCDVLHVIIILLDYMKLHMALSLFLSKYRPFIQVSGLCSFTRSSIHTFQNILKPFLGDNVKDTNAMPYADPLEEPEYTIEGEDLILDALEGSLF